MMDQLGITSIRPGVSGNNNAPNAANYDESKANPFPNLPDPLTLKNGKKITEAIDWWNEGRPAIVEDFDREIYGRLPENIPGVKWSIESTTEEKNGDYSVITKKIIGQVDNSSYPSVSVDIELNLTTPANSKDAVPIIVEFSFVFPPGFRPQQQSNEPTWREQLLAKGWGYATLIPTTIQADNGAGLKQGIIGLVNKGQTRKPEDWGALRAWAWGASKAMDYFETDPSVDEKQVGITGHSRYGKAAIVAMAYDPRIAIGFISSSGEGGVKLHRRNVGEIVENVAGAGEYHWMAGNFIKYAGPLTWGDLPVDSHELVALCAPRPVFISSGDQGDGWVDARGMFLAGAAAGPVYKLLGKKDLGTTEFPPVETGLMKGEIAFRQHSGGHTPAPNWPTFIEFADRYIGVIERDALKDAVYTWPTAMEKTKKSFSSTMMAGKSFDLSRLEVVAMGIEQKKSISLDADFEHVLFIKSGTVTVLMRDSSWTVSKGSVVVILPNENVTIKNVGKGLATFHDMKYKSKLPANEERGLLTGGSFVKDFGKTVFKPHERGGVRSYFDKPTTMTRRFEMHMTSLKEGFNSHDPHTHRDEEIILVYEGNIEIMVGKNHYKAGPGDFIFVPTKILHGLKNDGQGQCSYFAYQWE
jgi:quercetin dioxygenase-like cupin family protein